MMVNLQKNGGFHFFFIDDPLPACFEQKPGMTFRSLLLGENTKGQKTYEGIQSVFQNKPQELEAFISRFNELKNVESRAEFFQQKFIGNPEHHANLNNQVEWVFGKQGRIDACIIQQDGVRCVFILDVRPVSNHEKIADNPLHIQNRNLSDMITNAFNCTNYFKTKGAPFREGLLAYQNEHMETLNTLDARFSILLNTLEQLIFSNKDLYSKIAIFKNKLQEEMKGQSDFDTSEFKAYIEKQLTGPDINEYQRELSTKLYRYDDTSEDHLVQENEISKSFSNISNVRGLAVSLFSNLEMMFERENLKEKNVLDSFQILNKIPPEYFYVLSDVYADKPMDDENQTIQKRMTYFISQLSKLQEADGVDLFETFKGVCKDAFEKQALQTSVSYPIKRVSVQGEILPRENLFQELLNIHTNKFTLDYNVDKFSKALMKLIVEPSYDQMVLLVNNESNDQTLEDERTLGYQWIATGDIDETIGKAFQRILKEYPDLKAKVCEKRPFLTPYVDQLVNGKLPNFDEIHTICTLYNLYCTDGLESEFDAATEQLKKLNVHEKAFLEEYLTAVFPKTENYHTVLRFMQGAKSLVENEDAYQKKLELKKKESRAKKKALPVQSDKDIQRQNFIKAFEVFYEDVNDVEKYESFKQSFLSLDKALLARLKKLPGNNPVGVFVRDYLYFKEKEENYPFDLAVDRTVLRVQDEKKDLLTKCVNDFFDNFENKEALELLQQNTTRLSREDVFFMLDAWGENKDKYARQIAFFTAYKNYKSDDFESFLQDKLPSFAKIVADEIKKRIVDFKQCFRALFSDGDETNSDRLTQACLNLRREDFKLLLDDDLVDLSSQELQLLKDVREAKDGKSKNILEDIKRFVLTTKRRVVFQYAFNKLVKEINNKERIDKFLDASMSMEKTDFDVFISTNSNIKIVSDFFKKLKKIKNKKGASSAQRKDFSDAFYVFKDKVSFVRVVNNFLMEPPQEMDLRKLTTAFWDFSSNNPEALEEVFDENKEAYALLFVLSQMKKIKKETGLENFHTGVAEFIEKEGWKIEFFTMMDQYTAQNQPEEIKKVLTAMELHEIDAIIDTHMYKDNLFMQNELKKQQFCKTVEEFCLSVFKDKDLEKKTVSLFSSLVDVDLLDDVLKETEPDHDAHMMIVGAREFFKDSIRSALPDKALENKKIKFILSNADRKGFDKKIKDLLGAADYKDGLLSFILDLKEHNLSPVVVKKMRENIQKT